QACIAARHFPEEIQLHVNICPARLREPGIAEDVGSVLAESGLDGRRLSLELTESAILHDPETAATRLMALHDLGVRLALDDFGTGYSSLSHVRRFPVDTVKIDRTFVDTLGSETDGLNLVEAIVRFGQGLNLDIVAEGVETETQLEILESLGCGFAQGFFLARPAPLTRIREMFE
ncbi:MAG: EAL domain-containing protein, partial [Thermoanaerobaculia bacterium]|nr:EAL domain-containing protein [Thermoanaerobaculia bacterium]